MQRLLRAGGMAAILLGAGLVQSSRADEVKEAPLVPPSRDVPLASFLVRKLAPKENERVFRILEENHIPAVATMGAGVTVHVPEQDAQRAQLLLARAMWDEGLDLSLERLDAQDGAHEWIRADEVPGAKGSEPVCVASFRNSPAVAAREGARALQILKDHQLEVSTSGDERTSIRVPRKDERRARLFLAQAIRDEGLKIGLLRTNAAGDQVESMTSEKVLEEEKSVIVASYPNTKEIREKDGVRAFQILSDHYINAVGVGSAGMSIDVAARDETQARILLARAIRTEQLRIGLTRMNAAGDRAETLTLEEVLKAAE